MYCSVRCDRVELTSRTEAPLNDRVALRECTPTKKEYVGTIPDTKA